ncbi:site-specific tyrosine recombinase XerD [Streptococcus merionis]|uniref:Tyrosine recombinase XerD-like n=1 Tax=Streptococcus merionis TaxID=400065 RepID=A0A239STJ4_9STRE|nr:site-specific tyrosine recombinase XerD [Streptococcus merionis]SNU88825.1 site-specific tyrosine recombinase XerD-like protein [Streptococcus merionis]
MTAIDDFLDQKKLAQNSLSAYRYDLEQFRQLVEGEIEPAKLKAYQQFLTDLKPTAQKRKISAVNQFLYYLYETGQIKQFHKLSLPSQVRLVSPRFTSKTEVLDLAILWQKSERPVGQLFALFIWTMGLQPSEILQLEAEHLNLDFQILTVRRGQDKRVLKIPQKLLPYLIELPEVGFLFAKGGKPYSRQWLFNQLRLYLETIGMAHLTAQKLREQYILSQLASDVSLEKVAKNLGLKSAVTLEKYVR